MPISDIYTVDSAMISQTSITQTPILELRTGATKRAFIVGARMKIGVTTATAGNDVVFTLARAANTPVGGTAANLRPHSTASAAAISSAFTGSWTTAPTLGSILAEWVLPQATGSMWEEFPPLGYEWVADLSTSIVGFVTTTSTQSTQVEWQFVVSE